MAERDFYWLIYLSSNGVLLSGSLEPGLAGIGRAVIYSEESKCTLHEEKR